MRSPLAFQLIIFLPGLIIQAWIRISPFTKPAHGTFPDFLILNIQSVNSTWLVLKLIFKSLVMKNILRLISVFILEIALIASCELDLAPYDSLTVENLSLSDQGIESLANGCLMMMKENLSYSQGQEPDPRDRYVRHLNQLTEFPSDNLMIVKSTTDNLWYSFNIQHITGQINTTYICFICYKLILNANNIIEGVDLNENTSARVRNLL